MASPMTKGGVMMGSTVSALSSAPWRKPVRVTISAKTRPSRVVTTPTSTARKSEFQATPQRGPPDRQPRPQRRSLNSLPRKTPSE